MGGFFVLFPYLIPVLWFFFGNYAKREILVIIKPKKAPFYQSLILLKKTIKKAKEKTTLKPINKRKSKERKPRKKP